ncbi:FAD:protein FMN transferase [Halocynthiibacter sp. C4]|uniref:FAD:protein FMN transferase n=1 Tax=Halocynthiibacter sp. C4 TaxID=2992758 RepID=UPI00237B1540|nr:FAD:protein FMN transferase [Halocynthiibacter sp. C4]MDE0589135.1 FAD:protein FMN transferase [Halocynthiibacter sp. C4]
MTNSFTITRRAVFLAPLALAACKYAARVFELTGHTMGTTYTVVAVDRDRALSEGDVLSAIRNSLAQVNAEMSNWDASSEISNFNTARSTGSFAVSPALAEVVTTAQDIKAATGGKFDLTVGPLIDLWGFGANGPSANMPTERAIADAMTTNGVGGDLLVNGNALSKSAAETEIYVSALGKGHGVDRVAASLRKLGLNDFMVEIGGDLVTSGLNAESKPWQIGIEKPTLIERAAQKVIGASNYGVATSGDYRNYFERDGVRYSHILDAQTGMPVTHATASATVFAENAMLADAWSTAMLVLGRERGLEVAEEFDLAVYFLDRSEDGSGFIPIASPRFEAMSA